MKIARRPHPWAPVRSPSYFHYKFKYPFVFRKVKAYGLHGYNQRVYVPHADRLLSWNDFITINQNRHNYRKRNPKEIVPVQLDTSDWRTFRIKSITKESENYQRIRVQFQSRDEISRHPACSFLKIRFPGLTPPTEEEERQLSPIRCFPINDPYRPGLLDVLVREYDDKLDWSKIRPGMPVQVRGVWSWDLFPSFLVLDQKQKGKAPKWNDVATR